MDRQILEPAFSSTFKKLPDISTHVEIQLCCDISEWDQWQSYQFNTGSIISRKT